ncbi:MAG TPA: hypothetical protein PK867_12310, partial [Pirellulales bacterium]|nr:hypothetical protein [Pirellulales bacterium]
GAAATAGYTLTVSQTTALSISSISSYSGGNAGNVTMEIDGANFTATTTASLSLGGTTIDSSAVDFVSPSQLFATFNLSGAAAGAYTLKVTQGAQSATAAATFQVVAASPAALNVLLITPQYVRAGRTGNIVVTYTNQTANDMVSPLLTIDSSNPAVLFSTPDDPNNYVQQSQVLAVAGSGPAGILRPGQSGQLTLTLLANDTTNGDQVPITVSRITTGQTIDWASQKATLQPSDFPDAAWNVVWNNAMAVVGTTSDSYNAALAQAATYLGGIGDTTAQVSDVGRLWSFIIAQANASFPTPTLSSALDAALPTPSPGGLSLAIDRTFSSSIAGRYTQGIFGTGWTTSWQSSLSVDAATGDVTINVGGADMSFVAQPNGSFLDVDGELGTLVNAGGVYTYTDPSGLQYVFSPAGNLQYAQDTSGNRITLAYNASNQLVTLTYSNPADSSQPTQQLTLSYNSQGLVQEVDDGTGNKWTYLYDSSAHLLSVTAPGILTTTYTYDTGTNAETANALLSVTNPDFTQQKFSYDPATGRLTGTSLASGAEPVTYSYLGQGEVQSTDKAGNTTIVWFNDLGLPARTQNANGAITSSLYDSNGNLLQYTNGAGGTYQYAYGPSGALSQVVNPNGQTVQMSYGPLGKLTSLTDAAGNTTLESYNAAGDPLSITYPDGTSKTFTYDPLGNLAETVLQNGDAIAYQYNAQGLVSKVTFADKTSQTFNYDQHGNLLTAGTFDASGTLTGTTTMTYNAANELLTISYPSGLSLAFTYNAQGQRIKSVDQSGFTINYTSDSEGRLTKLTDGSGNLIVQYTYNDIGQLQKKVNGNSTSTVYGYDPAGNLTSIINYAPDGKTVNSSFTYTYNLLGEVTSMVSAAGTTTYGYDATGQLTSVGLPGGSSLNYVYNAAGDLAQVLTNAAATSYTSNSDNEITQVGSATYSYDKNGNLHSVTNGGATTTYGYNDLNQLVSITAPDGTVTALEYSPLGFLVGSSTTPSGGSTTQTNYLVDPAGAGNIVASYNGNSLIAHYTYGVGLVSQTGPSGTGYYDFDQTGDTVGITGGAGTYVNQYSYLPFGQTTTVGTPQLPNPFTFGGQQGIVQLGNDLFSMRSRVYDSSTG